MSLSVLAEISAADVAGAESVSTGVLIIRVIVGVTFAAHGYYKFFKGGKIAGTARWFDSMRMRPNGTVHAYLAATTELVAGGLLALGFLTPLAGAAIVGQMLVAGYTANRENGFWSASKGWEYNLILATVAVGVATIGPGKYSIDHQLELRQAFDPNIGLAVSLFLGLVSGVGVIVGCYRPPAPEPAPAAADED
ncbi:MAG TPA: DoxX family protein [Iamia sp.]|nr:DoxX family protein [Iamia sp.]